jgi:hypothetical protein
MVVPVRVEPPYPMKLQPAVWGPFFWHTIHIVALAYPSQPSYAHKRAAKEFFESLVHLIPCPICREHYQIHLQKFPLTPHLDRRADIFKWTVALHNEVNTSLGKPTVSELEALTFYRRIGARGKSPVINQEHLDEVDIRSMLKGGFIGAGIVLAAGAALWWINKGEGLGIPVPKPLSF